MAKLKLKQARIITYVLGAIASILIGILGFRFLGEYLTSRASDTAPKNLSITEITTNSAIVKWATDQETQVVIEYGTSPTSLTFFAPESTRNKDHRVELNLLTEATTYYFQIKAGEKRFDNGGVPWTFTTLSASSEKDDQTQLETSPSASEPESLPTLKEPEPSPTDTVSPTPSLTPGPTTDPSTVTKDTKCILDEYKNRFYTSAPEYDQDNNGIVNARDWSLCAAKLTATPTP